MVILQNQMLKHVGFFLEKKPTEREQSHFSTGTTENGAQIFNIIRLNNPAIVLSAWKQNTLSFPLRGKNGCM